MINIFISLTLLTYPLILFVWITTNIFPFVIPMKNDSITADWRGNRSSTATCWLKGGNVEDFFNAFLTS